MNLWRAVRAPVLVILPVLLLPMAAQAQGDVAMRTVIDDAGFEVSIPVQPQRIISLRGELIAAPLLELGAPLVGAGGISNEAVNGGAPYIRGAFDILDFRFENSPTVAYLGTDSEFDIEAIVAAQPDLIIAPAIARALDRRDQLMAVAPTVFVNQDSAGGPDNSPFTHYQRIADFAGMLDRYNELRTAFDERLERYRVILADQIPDPSEVTVAIVGFDNGTILQTSRYSDMLSTMIDALGFSYPPIVQPLTGTDRESLTISAEQLTELQSDFLISTVRWGFQAGSQRDKTAAMDAILPGWQQFLHATRNNQWIFLDQEQSRAVTFASARYTLDFLMTNIVLRPFVPLAAN